MNSDDIAGVGAHPRLDILGKADGLLQRGHIVVVDEEPLDAAVEMARVIAALAAQIVDLVFGNIFS